MIGQPQPLVLGSGSPRRREILERLGLDFRVVVSRAKEPDPQHMGKMEPAEFARKLATLKAEEVAGRLSADGDRPFVLGADTVVVTGEEVFGKPRDDREALRMLGALSGVVHQVITGLCLVRVRGPETLTRSVSTMVHFAELSAATVERYVATGEGRDKAGAYGIQDLGSGLVISIEGSYTNVVGLPAAQTLEMLRQVGALQGWP